MSKTKIKSDPFEQTTYQRAELEALRRMLRISEGTFSLSVAICNSPVLRDHLIEDLTSKSEGIKVVRIHETKQDVFGLVRCQVSGTIAKSVFVVDLENTLSEDRRDRVLQGLNASREQWRSAFQCPVVFWVPEYVIPLLMARARDLWSWVSHSFEFVSEQPMALANLKGNLAVDLIRASNLDAHEKQFRIAELEQRVSDLGDRATGQIKAHAWVWLQELVYLYFCIGELGKAEEALKRSLDLATADDSKAVSQSLHEMGIIHQMRGDYAKAFDCYEQSRKIDETIGNRAGAAGSLHQIASIYSLRGDYEKALEYSEQAKQILEESGNRAGLSKSLQQIGIIHHLRRDYDKAFEYFERAKEISEELNDRADISAILHDIGAVHQARGDYDRALSCYEQSQKLKSELGDRVGLSASLYQIGTIHKARGQYDKALAYYEQAKAIQEETGERPGLSRSLHAIGIIHQSHGDYAKALAEYDQSRRITEEIGDRAGLAHSHGQMGRLCVQIGKLGDAFEHSLLALAIFAEIGSPDGFKAANDLRLLRQTWGATEFDKAWREKTGQEVPEWVKEQAEEAEEQKDQANG